MWVWVWVWVWVWMWVWVCVRESERNIHGLFLDLSRSDGGGSQWRDEETRVFGCVSLRICPRRLPRSLLSFSHTQRTHAYTHSRANAHTLNRSLCPLQSSSHFLSRSLPLSPFILLSPSSSLSLPQMSPPPALTQ